MTVGEILAALRKEKNIGQKEVAAYLSVSIGTISNYEHNVHAPDLATLSRLADYFGVTADYILGRTACRVDPGLLNQRVSGEYTVTDIINTVLTFDTNAVNNLMRYARFLQTEPQSVLPVPASHIRYPPYLFAAKRFCHEWLYRAGEDTS